MREQRHRTIRHPEMSPTRWRRSQPISTPTSSIVTRSSNAASGPTMPSTRVEQPVDKGSPVGDLDVVGQVMGELVQDHQLPQRPAGARPGSRARP